MINNDPRHILSFFEEGAEDRINISVIDWQFLVILILIHVNEHYLSMKLYVHGIDRFKIYLPYRKREDF